MKFAMQLKMLNNNKASGPGGVSAEVLKHGGYFMLRRLHRFITASWTSGKIPQQWKDSHHIQAKRRQGSMW